MTTRLIQTAFLKGTRSFEIENDSIQMRIKTPFRKEKVTAWLSSLDPKPVINPPYLDFYDKVKDEPVISLLLNKPDPEQFNAFVDILKQRIMGEGSDFSPVSAESQSAGLAANIYEEPPKFGEFGKSRSKDKGKNVNPVRVAESIEYLEQFLQIDEVKPLLAALKALEAEPQNAGYFEQMEHAFNDLGITQGAVLTYAPYISILLADDPFED